MDIARFSVYCNLCRDYIRDRELEALVREEKLAAREAYIQTVAPNHTRARFMDWKPSPLELNVIDQNSRAVSSYGLRGLYNLGATCFMNSILQSLLHNPLMRSFFLSDQHNRHSCARQAAASPSQKICLSCDLDLLFSKAFSGETEPYSPHQLLYSMWTYSQELAGYEQQDAHEFFISLLNGIHQHSGAAQVGRDLPEVLQ
jgi:ubiquitin carboxyl-terminal hydrolase 22/27/51